MDPASIAFAVAMMLGSMYYKKRATDAQTHDTQAAAAAERIRQGDLDRERMGDINATLHKFSPSAQTGDQSAIAQKLQQYFTAPQDTNPNVLSQQTNPAAPQEIKDREQATLAAAHEKGRDYAARLADLSSYNLVNFNTGVTLNRLGERQANLSTSQARSASILPFELQSIPFRSGANDTATADALAGGSTLAAAYGGGQRKKQDAPSLTLGGNE